MGRTNMVMKRVAVASLVLVVVCLPGCSRKDRDNAPARIHVKVGAGKVLRRTLVRRRVFTGVLEANRKADLAPLMGGKVRRLYCKVGDRVGKGKVLVNMDDASLVQTIAQFQPLKSQYERSQRLQANGAMSKAQYESVEAQYLALKRQVEQLKENTRIAAPFSGVVTWIAVEEGEMYSPQMAGMAGGGSSGLIQVARLDPLRIDLAIDDKTVAFVEKGMDVEITTDVMPDTSFFGTVEWVNPVASASSRTFQVRVKIPNRSKKLRAGYFVEVKVVVDRKENCLSVPVQAVQESKAFVVKDTLSTAQKVELGWAGDDYVEVLTGLSEGDIVVVSGNKALPDTALVTVVD